MTDWQEQFARLRRLHEERERTEQERLLKRRDEILTSLRDLERAADAEAEIALLRNEREELTLEVAELQARRDANRKAAAEAQLAEVRGLTAEIEDLMQRQEGHALREQLEDAAGLFADLHFDLKSEPLSALRAKLQGGTLRDNLLTAWREQLSDLDTRLSKRDGETGRSELSQRRLAADDRIRTAQDQLRTENSVTHEVLEALRGFDATALRRFLDEVISPYESDLIAEQSWKVPTTAGSRFPALREPKVP